MAAEPQRSDWPLEGDCEEVVFRKNMWYFNVVFFGMWYIFVLKTSAKTLSINTILTKNKNYTVPVKSL